jgi:hypothetical protein
MALPALAFVAAGCMTAGALANREPVSAASNLPNRLVVAQLAADSSSGAKPASATTTAIATPTRTPTPTPPEIIPEPMPTSPPPDPYPYPYPY